MLHIFFRASDILVDKFCKKADIFLITQYSLLNFTAENVLIDVMVYKMFNHTPTAISSPITSSGTRGGQGVGHLPHPNFVLPPPICPSQL